MKRFVKAVSVFIVIALVSVQLCGCSLLMDYQSDYEKYSEQNFSNISYKRPDTKRFFELSKSIEANCGNFFKAISVNDWFTEMIDIYNDMYAMISLLSIYTACDITDKYYAEEYLFLRNEVIAVSDELNRIVSVLKDSKCAYMIEFYNDKSIWEYFEDYEEKSENDTAFDELTKQENTLISKYNELLDKSFTIPADGLDIGDAQIIEDNALSLDELDFLYENGILSSEEYIELQREIYLKKNKAYGDVYVELVSVRKQIAKNRGASSYADYAYGELYAREYTVSDIREFRSYVKEALVPFYNELVSKLDYTLLDRGDRYISEIYPSDLTKTLKPVLSSISGKMGDAYEYMISNNACSFEYSPNKAQMSFTTYVDCYGIPYIFCQPSETATAYDFFTVVHEFGHYFDYYTNSVTDYNSIDLDSSEVLSQGLELIFSEHIGDVFKDGDVAAQEYIYVILNILSSVISGCMYDEFQELVFTSPDCTVENINKIFGDVRTAYGSDFYDAGDGQSLSWIDVTHNFIAPFYYISYASSAVAALQIWSLENCEDAYFEFLKNSAEMFFMDNIKECGLGGPFEADTLEKIIETVRLRYSAVSGK